MGIGGLGYGVCIHRTCMCVSVCVCVCDVCIHIIVSCMAACMDPVRSAAKIGQAGSGSGPCTHGQGGPWAYVFRAVAASLPPHSPEHAKGRVGSGYSRVGSVGGAVQSKAGQIRARSCKCRPCAICWETLWKSRVAAMMTILVHSGVGARCRGLPNPPQGAKKTSSRSGGCCSVPYAAVCTRNVKWLIYIYIYIYIYICVYTHTHASITYHT